MIRRRRSDWVGLNRIPWNWVGEKLVMIGFGSVLIFFVEFGLDSVWLFSNERENFLKVCKAAMTSEFGYA